MEYINNPHLPTIKENYPGNPWRDGRFLNYQKVPAPSLTDILAWRFSDKPLAAQKQADQFRLTIEDHPQLLDPTLAKIVWLGHASFLITLNGKNILLDPVFDNIPLVRRRERIPNWHQAYQPIDYILISHAHYDHLDKRTVVTLTQLNPKLRIYCGLNSALLLRQWGISNPIIEAGWYQQFPKQTDEINFYFLPTLHWSKRGLFDRNLRLWGSFIMQTPQHCIYFMGDSGYAAHFAEIGELFPKIDYALLGIGAYLPRNIMRSSHINPEEASRAYADLKAKYMIPMHYATYDLTDEPFSQPLQLTKQFFSHNPEALKVLNPGQLLILNK